MTATLKSLLDELSEALEGCPDCQGAVDCTCSILRRFAEGRVELPDRVTRVVPGAYARHLVYRDAGKGHVVVAMVWGPGQGTAVHDHGGTWCVEGCLQGNVEITNYRMLDQLEDGTFHFQQEDSLVVGCGQVGHLIPPFEHHRIHNPFEIPALTLHVYGRELTSCRRFLSTGAELYRAETVALGYASLPDQESVL